jgi:excisionase family DNA binding protein
MTVLSTADIARLFNVTETTVKRWADEGTLKCQKTPGGHRKFLIRNVVEFAERNNFEPVGILAFSETDALAPAIQMAVLSRDFGTLVDSFIHKALSPSKTDLASFLSYLYEHRIHLWEIHDLVLRPAMATIGERWANGELDVSHEHRASYETLDALARLQSQIMIKPALGNVALFACPGEELHEIGLRCASYLFESEGWTTHYLGARVPSEALVAAVCELKPVVVCLSVTRQIVNPETESQMLRLSSAARKQGALIVAGGSGAGSEPFGRPNVDRVVSSSRELLDLMSGVGHSTGPLGAGDSA